MSSPLVEPSDLGTYLNDSTIDTGRAAAMIADAQALCESIVSPLPTTASVVVKRVAARGYVTTNSRQAQAAAVGPGVIGASPGMGGVYLTRADKADLRRLAGGSSAFSIDPVEATYALPTNLPYWDADTYPPNQ